MLEIGTFLSRLDNRGSGNCNFLRTVSIIRTDTPEVPQRVQSEKYLRSRMNSNRVSRRHFFYGSLLAGVVPAGGFGSTPSLKGLGFKTVLDKLNIAGIGVGGRGGADLVPMAVSENIVALCDVNEVYAAKTFQRYPNIRKGWS